MGSTRTAILYVTGHRDKGEYGEQQRYTDHPFDVFVPAPELYINSRRQALQPHTGSYGCKQPRPADKHGAVARATRMTRWEFVGATPDELGKGLPRSNLEGSSSIRPDTMIS